MGHIVEAEAAFDAEPILVRGTVTTADIEQLVVLDVVGELAADAAIGAHAVDRAIRILRAHVGFVHQGGRHERAGRASLHAFAAGDAGRGPHRVIEVEHDLLAVATPGHADHVVDLHFAAGTDAEIALNAGVEIDRHCGVAAIGNRLRPAGEPARRDILQGRRLPELRLRIVRDVLGRLIGEQKFHHHPARRLGTIGLGLHLHPRRRRADAARGQHALAFDLDHAGTAIAVGAVTRLGRIAQMRDVGALALRHLPDRLARMRMHFDAVESEGHGPIVAALVSMRDVHPAVVLGGADGSTLVVVAIAHRGTSALGTGTAVSVRAAHDVTSCRAACSAPQENISARSAADWAPPDRARRSRHRASRPRAPSTTLGPMGRLPSA